MIFHDMVCVDARQGVVVVVVGVVAVGVVAVVVVVVVVVVIVVVEVLAVAAEVVVVVFIHHIDLYKTLLIPYRKMQHKWRQIKQLYTRFCTRLPYVSWVLCVYIFQKMPEKSDLQTDHMWI